MSDPESEPKTEPETETESLALDAEDWEIAFEVYEEHPMEALTLAYHLITLKSYLQSKTKNIPEALAAIDRAVDSLCEHSDFRHVSHQLFRTTIEGALTVEQENLINQLGIRT